jgi:UDP-N-acetylenolpyruvoylglucosamine reductase
MTVGPVRVSDVHANFLVASHDATAADIHAFVFEIQSKVFELTEITLEPEIRFLGTFDRSGDEQ